MSKARKLFNRSQRLMGYIYDGAFEELMDDIHDGGFLQFLKEQGYSVWWLRNSDFGFTIRIYKEGRLVSKKQAYGNIEKMKAIDKLIAEVFMGIGADKYDEI